MEGNLAYNFFEKKLWFSSGPRVKVRQQGPTVAVPLIKNFENTGKRGGCKSSRGPTFCGKFLL